MIKKSIIYLQIKKNMKNKKELKNLSPNSKIIKDLPGLNQYQKEASIGLMHKVYFSTTRINFEKSNINPAVIYPNADIDKDKIIKENSKKSGIYR